MVCVCYNCYLNVIVGNLLDGFCDCLFLVVVLLVYDDLFVVCFD